MRHVFRAGIRKAVLAGCGAQQKRAATVIGDEEAIGEPFLDAAAVGSSKS
jgi:hypothetical protein